MDTPLLTLALCCAALAAVNGCSESEFRCQRKFGGYCLPQRWVCDGDNDCVDSSDENVCGSPRTCPDGFFSCQSGRCIPDNWVCDGANDCRDDGTDEQNCDQKTTPTPVCPETEFACQRRSGHQGCINIHWVCDGDFDCLDHTDESQCGSPRSCPDGFFSCQSGRCITASWVCDGTNDCFDNGTDEENCKPRNGSCSEEEFACESNRRPNGCIPLQFVCDGDSSDCVDGSDERNCGMSPTCPAGWHACASGRCIPGNLVCDGGYDCPDGSDESQCGNASQQRHCAADEFACQSHRRSSGCIPRSWVCDGDHGDCIDGSDERDCPSQQQHCSADEFACRSPRRSSGCIPRSWVCDGDHGDCYDGSDERDCEHHRCAADEFACRSPRRTNGCIPRAWVCDGDRNDCFDESDERDCGSHDVSTTPSTTTACSADEFACRSPRRSSGCIPRSWVCDGDHGDCHDGSDERDCEHHRCAADEFACRSRRRANGCIPRAWVCDGDRNDCFDESDERDCGSHDVSTTPSTTAACAADEFACRSPRRSSGCIPRSWVCDGDRGDCYDESDERDCPGAGAGHCAENEFSCRSRRRSNGCIPITWVCDGDNSDCYDGSDESNCGSPRACPAHHFACDSGRCIPEGLVCDGSNNCGDPDGGSDERNCDQRHCGEDEFACQSNRRSSGCIPRSWVCDGDHGDCVDDSDESHCGANTTEPTPATASQDGCSAEQFACASRRWRGGCVPLAAVCDARAGDCDDGSDETHCGAARACPERWFACASGRCLPPAMICDGRVQCADAGDETHCGKPGVADQVLQTPERGGSVGEARGGAVRVELPSWLATDQDAHFALSLAPMLRARNSRDKLDAQMAVLRLFRDLGQN